MTTKTDRKQHTAVALLNHATIREILNDTAGLWHGRNLDPIAYQRAMRKSYSTVRRKK